MDFMNLDKMHIKTNALTGLIVLLFVLMTAPQFSLMAQTKRAVLIGIGNYPAEGGWAGLSSKNDINLIKATLAERGFQKENMVELADDQATRTGILKLLTQDFVRQVQPNDVVYFHFSGHGQQKQDFEGDELDGLDECIVPYDSPKKFQKGVYEGQNLITDDELGKTFLAVRQKLGPKGQLFVVLDACHSGTGTRGMSSARGTTEVMADPDYLNKKIHQNQNQTETQFELEASNKISPMVSFFGSAQNQLNYEMKTENGEQYGSLSYALAKHLTKVGPETSYRSLFDNIRLEMSSIAPLQNPQCEGALDMEIANGKLLDKPVYYKASVILSDTEFVIKAGELHGLVLGTELGLFPPDTRDISSVSPLAVGRVVKSYPSESRIVLEKPMAKELVERSWLYVTQKSFGNLSVRLAIEIGDQEIREGLETFLFSKPYIIRDQTAPDLTVKILSDKSKIEISSKEGYVVESISLAGVGLEFLCNKSLKAIRGYLQGEMMRRMDMEGSDIKVTFRIIPIDSIGSETDPEKLKSLGSDPSGVKKLSLKSKIKILIVNEGIKPAYFNLIDLQPDNKYNVIIPSPHSNPEEMRILPDQKILYPTQFDIGAPLGTEVFKLISSDKPIDLRSSVNTRGIKTNSFEKLFSDDVSDEELNTRSVSKPRITISDIHIFTDTFTITNPRK